MAVGDTLCVASSCGYSRARRVAATDGKHARGRPDDKRRVRLDCIAHILGLIAHKKGPRDKVKFRSGVTNGKYDDQPGLKGRNFVPERSRMEL